jgi:hypothetical protein
MIGQHDFQKGHATAIFRETMTNPPSRCGTKTFSGVVARGATRCAGHIEFGGFRQRFQLIENFFVHKYNYRTKISFF